MSPKYLRLLWQFHSPCLFLSFVCFGACCLCAAVLLCVCWSLSLSVLPQCAGLSLSVRSSSVGWSPVPAVLIISGSLQLAQFSRNRGLVFSLWPSAPNTLITQREDSYPQHKLQVWQCKILIHKFTLYNDKNI